MKFRTSFVTNSSSTSYILMGESFDAILEYLTKYKVFSFATARIVDAIKKDGVEKLESVFNTEKEVQDYITVSIKSFEKMVEIDKKYNIDTSGRYSKNFVKVLKKEHVLDVENNVGMIIEVGDNHGTFQYGGWDDDADVEFPARRELDCSAGLDKDVVGFWESNR